VLSGNVTIEGFTFADPQRLHWTIVATDHIATGLQLTFRNNRVTDGNRYGFWDYHSHGILLCENNSFSDVYYGMLLEGWDTGMVTIQNNEFTNLHFYLDQNGVANPAFGGPVGILSMTYSADGGVDCANPYRIFENHFHTYFNDGFGIVFNGGLTGLGSAKYTDVEIARNTIAPGATGTGIRLRNLPAPNNSPNGGVHNAGIYNNFISNVLFGIRLQGDNPGTEATQNSLVNCSTDAIENTGTALMEASCNWYGSAAAANVAPQISGNVNYQFWLVNGTDDDLVTLGFQPVSGSCTGCAQPLLQTTINTVVVTSNNDGTDDTGSFSVCNGEDVVFDNFQDISGLGLSGLKVYQTAVYTNLTPTFCNNCAALLSTYTGTMETATLVNPAISGTLVLRFRAWADADGNNMVDPGECSGDWIQYTITVLPTQIWYADADGDGYGDPASTTQACSPPVGYVADNTDCDDNDDEINPAATEICDGIDNNCNGMTDEGVQFTFYEDVDGDGYGDPNSFTMDCMAPIGYVSNDDDCNDNDDEINPAATEICDGIDNNCDTQIDEGLTFTTYYTDADGDGYGTGAGQSLCANPGPGFATLDGDCNDNDDEINPGETEICDGIDNDCDTQIDEGLTFTTYYTDADGDGYGTGAGQSLCANPGPGFATLDGDCNDNDDEINPGATEICDGIDNDCDGQTDEGVKTPYFADTDGDGFGDPNNMIIECSQPQGYVANNDDCDDTDNTVNPSEEEVCDNKDNDCNGITDDIGGATTGNWNSGDVGGANGNANFPPCNAEPSDVFTINATGFSTSSSDKLHAVYQELCGNGEIIARVLNVQNGGWAGIMLRETLNPGSKKVSLKTQLTPSIRREIRSTTNGAVSILNFNRPQHVWLRLTRNGSNFVGYTSIDGANWSFAFSATISMNGCIYAGLFAESINASVTTTATFDNVSIIGGAPALGATTQPASALDGMTVSVYPNPNSGEMTLSVAGAPERNLQLEVTDMMGRIVRNIELREGAVFTYPLDLSDEPAGVYFLRLRSEAGVESVQRIVVQQ